MVYTRNIRAPGLQRLVYHLADATNWSSIERHGLLSTRTLLHLACVSEVERTCIERRQRIEQVVLPGGIVIRDQKPLPPAALERCLSAMTSTEWYALLNTKVFFWLDVERLNRMRHACRERPQVVMFLDSERLLARHGAQAALTPINTGNARRKPALRGRATFVPYTTWLDAGWRSEAEALGTRYRPQSHQPVELTVSDAVPDVMDFVVKLCRLEPGEPLHLSGGVTANM